ncbi:MAG: efflux RND transporter periplasmic adaptor subunit [Blautia sp.]|nr:efflux RND transporter periplasmic adaptor subunit [Blautia sp.]
MKKSVVVISGLLVIAIAAGGVYWYRFQDQPLEFRENLEQLKDEFFPADSDPVYVTLVSTITGSSNAGIVNRFAGVVEPQSTVDVRLESNRIVKDLYVKVGDEVKQGQLLFEYDLSNIEDQLQEENLAMERLKNEALSLEEQLNTLEKEKKKAKQDSQLSYTIEIETTKMNLKKNEYDQKGQQAKIDRLQNATGNTEVRSEIDGVIQKIDTSQMATDDSASVTDSLEDFGSSYDSGDNSGAFMTILSTGSYRVKGKVNELNINEIVPGDAVIIRSRLDESITWTGLMGMVDRDNADKSSDDNMYFGMSSSDSQTNSSTYPFYVELDSSDDLMLGQHVYIELDNGQEDQKEGLWLSEFYIVDADTDHPFVWAANDKNRLEKRSVELGEYDEILGEYEILEGLSQKDYITYPADDLEEGMKTSISETVMFDDSDIMDYDDMDYPEEDLEGDLDLFDEDDFLDEDEFTDEDMEFPEDLTDEELEAYYADDDSEEGEEVIEEQYYIDEDGNEVLITEDTPRYLYEDVEDDMDWDDYEEAEEELFPAEEP